MTAVALAGRDLRVQLRSRGVIVAVWAVVATLAVTVVAMYRTASVSKRGLEGVGLLVSSGVGRAAYHTVLFLLLAAVCIVVPVLGAQSIAGERDRSTLVPVLATRLRARSFLTGKVLAAFVPVVLLVAASAPAVAGAFLLGGLTGLEVLRGLGTVIVFGLALSIFTVAVSSRARTASGALAASFLVIGALVVGTLLAYGLQALVTRETDTSRINHALLVANPFVVTADAIGGPSGGTERFPSAFTPFHALAGDRVTLMDDLLLLPSEADGFFFRRFRSSPTAPARQTRLWFAGVSAWSGLAVLSLFVAWRAVRLPRTREVFP